MKKRRFTEELVHKCFLLPSLEMGRCWSTASFTANDGSLMGLIYFMCPIQRYCATYWNLGGKKKSILCERCFSRNVKWCEYGGPCLLHEGCQHCNNHYPGVTVICWDRNDAKASIYWRWFHMITEKFRVGKDLWRSLSYPHTPSRSVFKDLSYCSETCSVKFWKTSVVEIPWPCWATALVPGPSLLPCLYWWAGMT